MLRHIVEREALRQLTLRLMGLSVALRSLWRLGASVGALVLCGRQSQAQLLWRSCF